MNWNPFDPRDPKTYFVYNYIFNDDDNHNSSGRGPKMGCGHLSVLLVAFVLAIVILAIFT